MLLAWQHVCLQYTNSSWQNSMSWTWPHDVLKWKIVTHVSYTLEAFHSLLCVRSWRIADCWHGSGCLSDPVTTQLCQSAVFFTFIGSFFRHSSGLKVYHRSHSLCPVSPVAAWSYRIVYFLWSPRCSKDCFPFIYYCLQFCMRHFIVFCPQLYSTW